jgi:hypothetical protein
VSNNAQLHETKSNRQTPIRTKRRTTENQPQNHPNSSKLLRQATTTGNRAFVVASDYTLEATTKSTYEDDVVRKVHVLGVPPRLRLRRLHLSLEHPRGIFTGAVEVFDGVREAGLPLWQLCVPVDAGENEGEGDERDGDAQRCRRYP